MNNELFNITTGNAAVFRVALTRYEEPFPVEDADDVQCSLISSIGQRMSLPFTVGEGFVLVSVPAFEGVGLYGIEIKGTLLENRWRVFTGGIIRYTQATEQGSHDMVIPGEPYDITCEVQLYTAGDSARKLSTPRDIWGQPFDGTANVSGAMTGVTNINGMMTFGEEAVSVDNLVVTGELSAPITWDMVDGRPDMSEYASASTVEALSEGLDQAAFWVDDEADDEMDDEADSDN